MSTEYKPPEYLNLKAISSIMNNKNNIIASEFKFQKLQIVIQKTELNRTKYN